MKINTHCLFGLTLLISLLANTVASKSKHHQCKRMDLSKALKKQKDTAPCAGKLLPGNINEAGIPLKMTEIVCPSEMGDRCIQLVLPMQISVSGADGQDEQKNIFVRSGCIDGSHAKKKSKTDKVLGKTHKDKHSSKVLGR
ncbi:hypothetical protein GHT06_013341 [Daphnia sinensis]|uniref:Secreted protein n=1 Tax=Daphnia sinensis TaxID=1820382 RepID=A0AAD5LGQ8_9CRUS|nr:hypothetical protein GHT06_013341 [Daphnia sinensis]